VLHDALDGLKAPDHGHDHVHGHHIRLKSANQFLRLASVASFSDNLKLIKSRQRLAQQSANKGGIIDDQY
jgi:hypothetical protein